MKNVKYRGNSADKRRNPRLIPRLKYLGKTQIPRIGSKFRGPRKTVGPTDDTGRCTESGNMDYYYTKVLRRHMTSKAVDDIIIIVLQLTELMASNTIIKQ